MGGIVKDAKYDQLIREVARSHEIYKSEYTIKKSARGYLTFIRDCLFEFTYPDYHKNIKYIVHRIIHGPTVIDDIIARAARGKEIFEIGCQFGTLILEIARNNPNANILGVDISEHNLGIARNYYDRVRKKEKIGAITYAYHDMNVTPLPEERFDVIISMATFVLLVNKKLSASEIRKALKKGGYLLAYEGVREDEFLEKNSRRVAILFFPLLFIMWLIKKRKVLSYRKAVMFVKSLYGWKEVRPVFGVLEQLDYGHEDIFDVMSKELDVVKERKNRCFIDCIARTVKKSILTYPLFFVLHVIDEIFLSIGFLEGTMRYTVFKKRD